MTMLLIFGAFTCIVLFLVFVAPIIVDAMLWLIVGIFVIGSALGIIKG